MTLCYCIERGFIEGILATEEAEDRKDILKFLDYFREGELQNRNYIEENEGNDGHVEKVYLTNLEKYLLTSKLSIQSNAINNQSTLNFKNLLKVSQENLKFKTLYKNSKISDFFEHLSAENEADSPYDPVLLVLSENCLKVHNEIGYRGFGESISKREVEMVEGRLLCKEEGQKLMVEENCLVCYF